VTWPAHIEQWRQFATWEAKDLPVDLVLAIVAHESGGVAGIKSHRTTADTAQAELPLDSGTTQRAVNDLGLMQCSPALVADWNKKMSPRATLEDMTNTDERAARLQLRIGCWYLAACVKQLNTYAPQTFPGASAGTASAEQLRLALVAYAGGWGGSSKPGGRGLKPKLDALTANGRPLTLEEVIRAFPDSKPPKAAAAMWAGYAANAPAGVAARPAGAPAGPRMLPAPSSPGAAPAAGAAPTNGNGKKPFDLQGWVMPGLMILAAFVLSRPGGLGGLFGGGEQEEEEEEHPERFGTAGDWEYEEDGEDLEDLEDADIEDAELVEEAPA
jgi:hypothetical protein